MINSTKNQHFVSQVEQRLNSNNPNAQDRNKRIFSFRVEDRESYSVVLESMDGCKISSNLSLNDIFSFDVVDGSSYRYNFEEIFHQYEKDIKKNTESLIFKLRTLDFDVKKEVEAIFKSKFINFIRNPYSIKKVLNTFPQLKNYQPTGSPHNEHFSRIIHGVRPHQKYLCDQLEITDKEYAEWLSVIFLLTTSLMDGHENILEKSISGLINNPDIYTMVYVYTYSDETCLLSDRGYSIPLPDDEHMAWDFNLCRAGFIRYVFVNINSIAGAFASKDRIDDFKISKKAIYFSCVHDDFDILQRYNKNVVYQCYSRVFNAKNNCYGLV